MAQAVGNIFIGLFVDTSRSRALGTVADSVVRDSSRMRTALGNTSRSVTQLRAQMGQGFRMRLFNDVLRQASQANNEVAKLRAAMLALTAITGTSVSAGFAGAFLLQTADAANRLNNQLRTVTDSEENLIAVRRRLHDISQLTRSDMQASVTLFARNSRAAREFGKTQEEMLRVTETIQKAFAIGGASQAEASGAAIQLSQGIASDRFSGEEYRSVAENAPVLLQAMAKHLDVTIGKLREMAHAGELTGKVVIEAIQGASDIIDEDFNKTIPTVGQSLTRLNNAFLQNIGNVDESYGVTRRLSEAMSNLAENFEDVAYWAGVAGVAGLSIFGARLGSRSTKSAIAALIPSNDERSQLRKYLQELAATRSQIKREIEATQSDLRVSSPQGGVGPVLPDRFNREVAAARAAQVDTATRKQVTAQQALEAVEKRRADLIFRMSDAQAGVMQRLHREKGLAEANVARDAERLALAQHAAQVEEQRLRAMQAQRTVAAGELVGKRTELLATAQGRAEAAAAAIDAKRAAEIGALKDKIEKRHIGIVTAGLKLVESQKRIAHYRAIADADGLDQKQMAAYRRHLKRQQEALISQQALRKEAAGFAADLAKLEAGGSNIGIDAAMKRHETAVRRVKVATESLAKAEAERSAIVAAPIGGKRLDQRIEAEQKAMAAYGASLEAAKVKAAAFNAAMASGVSSPAIEKIAAQIKQVDTDLVTAHTRLAAASKAVTQAYAGDAAVIAKAESERAAAVAHVTSLQRRYNEVTDLGAAAVKRMTVATRAFSIAQRVGGSILNFVGGPVGVAFLAAIAGITVFTGHMAALEERTNRTKRELHDLGLITDEVAGVTEKAAKSLDEYQADELRNRLRDLADEMARQRGGQNPLEQLLGLDPKLLGNMLEEIDSKSTALFGQVSILPDDAAAAARALRDLVVQTQEGRISAEDLADELDKIAAGNPNLPKWLDTIITNLRLQGQYLEASATQAERLQAALAKIGQDGPDTRWIEQMIAEQEAIAKAIEQGNTLRSAADQMVTEAGWSDEESRLEKVIAALQKEASARGEIDAISRASLELEARRVIAAEDAAAKRKEEAKAVEDLAAKIAEFGKQAGDGWTGSQISQMLKDFEAGTIKADSLKSRLEAISQVGLSEEMQKLIDKIIAAIPEMAALLGIYRSFSTDAAAGITVGGRSTAGSGRFSAIGDRVVSDAIADAGMSDKDSSIAGKAKDLQDRAAAAGGYLSPADAKTAAEEIWKIEEATKAAGKATDDAADAAEKYAEGMQELRDQVALAPLGEFATKVFEAAEAMGFSRAELDAFISSVGSGGLDAAPEKFREIAKAMQEVAFASEMADLKFEAEQMFRGETDQRIFETLRDMGIEVDSAYGRIIANNITLIEQMKSARDISKEFLGGLVSDLMNGASFTEALSNAFGRLGERLIQMALDQAINSLFANLMGSVFGVGGFGGIKGLPGVGGLVGSVSYSAKGNVFSSPGLHAYSNRIVSSPTVFPISGSGLHPFAKGAGVMGEAGPEAIIPLKRTADGRLGVAAMGGGLGEIDGRQPLEIHNHITLPAGASPETAPVFAREFARELRIQLPDALAAVDRNPMRRPGRRFP